MNEKERIDKVYMEYSSNRAWGDRYSIFHKEVIYSVQEVERKKIALLKEAGFAGKLD